LLAGVVRRAIETASGGQATLEIVNRVKEPDRHRAVMESVSIPHDVDVWGLVLVGELIDVGFFKNVIVKRVENEILSRVKTDALPIVIEPILQRVNGRDYAALQAALGVKQPPVQPAERIIFQEPEVTEDEENTHSVVAYAFALLAVIAGRRLLKFLWSYTHHSDLAAELDRQEVASSAPSPPQGQPIRAQSPRNPQSRQQDQF